MSQLYEDRLHRDLNQIRTRVADVSALVENALNQSVSALLLHDRQLANEIIIGDFPINRTIRQIDRLCHYFVARHFPGAGHLRFVSSVLRMNIAIERIGDYAVTIARQTKALSQPMGEDLQAMVKRLADEASHMLAQAIKAFDERDADLARSTTQLAYQIDATLDEAFELLVVKTENDAQSIIDRFGTLIILNRLERVSDQAKNICEETVFALTGETKKRKDYHILFLEEADDCRSQMAVAYAQRAYPGLGTFSSAGVNPASEVSAACALFLEEKGIYLDQITPLCLGELPADWEAKHIIVSLDGPVEKYIDNIPFHTVVLEWKLPPAPTLPADWPEVAAGFEEIYRELTSKIGALVETLYGVEIE